MKNSYFLRSILLFTFISFLNCISASDEDGTEYCQSLKKNVNWKCQSSKSCWYYTKYKNETRLNDYTPILPCGSSEDSICCPERIYGDRFCQQVKNLSGWKCEFKESCSHYDATYDQSTSSHVGRDIKCTSGVRKICCPPPPPKCGEAPLAPFQPNTRVTRVTRVVGGTNAEFGAWPWQVSIRIHGHEHYCGGVIINKNWVVTAAHCVMNTWNRNIVIRAGEHDLSSTEERYPHVEIHVVRKVIHRNYLFATQNDIAMLKLESPLKYAPHIRPICLPENDDLLVGKNAIVTGWGRLAENGSFPPVLQQVSVPILSNNECESMFTRSGSNDSYVPDKWLCAGLSTGGKDACDCDSGGPLQVERKDGMYFLAGIVHGGQGCAEPNKPGIYMRISKFVPWIQEIIKNY